jgi:hypothetical protein
MLPLCQSLAEFRRFLRLSTPFSRLSPRPSAPPFVPNRLRMDLAVTNSKSLSGLDQNCSR